MKTYEATVEDLRIAKEIMRQIGGLASLRLMLRASEFVAIERGVRFMFKGSRTLNRIQVTLNALDLYDLEIGKVHQTHYEKRHEEENLYFDTLQGAIERATGLYLTFSPRKEATF